MRYDYLDQMVTEETQKNKSFNILRTAFSGIMLLRFRDIRGSIENIWDLVANKAALAGRLQTIAAKDPSTWTINNLIDMSLICCILWNGTEDTSPEE